MSDYLLVQGATVLCSHGAKATPSAALSRVKVQGMAVVGASTLYPVAGCSNQLPTTPPTPQPCAVGQFTAPTTKQVKVMGQPLLLESSQGKCEPTQTPLKVTPAQKRVKAK